MKHLGDSGVTVKASHYLDESENLYVVEHEEDVEPTIERNKAMQNEFTRFGKETFHHVASIPPIIMLKWLNEEGINAYRREGFEHIIAKKLNDPDWKYLKTIPGRI
jgi:hypothetical protein